MPFSIRWCDQTQWPAMRQNDNGLSVLLTAVWLVAQTIVAVCALFVYGIQWPREWQTRVPRTNMRDVEKALGKPGKITAYSQGIVRWDYTRWWSGTAHVYFETNGNFSRIFTEW